MLAKRIIPCLDVINNQVIKGIQFQNHQIIGDIVSLAQYYSQEGADELVFYDIMASPNNQTVSKKWVAKIAEVINIPFCVAGGISTLYQAKEILKFGADKISINSPALLNPSLIQKLADHLGTQCVVVGIDAWYNAQLGTYQIKCFSGNSSRMQSTTWELLDWVIQIQQYGAGEIVLNMMNQDGMQNGYDLKQLSKIRKHCTIPLIASGGAGTAQHFLDVFQYADVDGALAASVFHKKIIKINELKNFLIKQGVEIRLC
ncbi:imidazole glycerol phosphate synthase, subunit with HisH [Candidatus Blochmanniella floridana]|uniref:Imidazole glycerol phosphate synthase subunit HisF n=1 Tax=Blochmanniella floridana TaxID=203907 RepID=HIS6_BLOFL|nr:RecName: Full=Imidazole glycerol phosphate synthase subunit HisF; AltName: Full=IGP synthase cyclase subunit; AltName: Full=IGP synthase subunit HisF; AltName: Full=ImGP synthase subunit HisF; Short=IGPS subunit HisF [Candidatus Blochmannia floridanus]CAD83527.1 imidazole glycerol phosphate synthase, subunit with HisH [Candidatus Blochmannia floridanus]